MTERGTIYSYPVSALELNEGQAAGLPANPRTWSRDELVTLKKSLEETPELFDARPVLAWEYADGRYIVLGGNMRLCAARELGWETVPTYVFPRDTPADKLMEIVIKDNGAFGAWDWDVLANEWDNGRLADWGVPTWKVDDDEEHEQATAQEDDFDEDEDEIHVVCQRGDIWQLGEHRLMCGDSTNADDVAKLMNGERADITFSSPPYNLMASNFTKVFETGKVKETYKTSNGTYNEFSDNLSNEEYSELLCKALQSGLQHSDDVLFNVGILASSKQGIIEMLTRYRGNFLDIIVWNKSSSLPLCLPSNRGVLSHRCELIFCFNKKGTRSFHHPQWDKGVFNGELMINRIDSYNASGNEFSEEHHATFPVDFAAQVVERFSNNSVLDLFGGTGTTMIACEQLGRKCYMMEIDPHYCDIVIARWEKLTGAKAVKL